MYRYLWSNGPKECLEFADYSFEEHFGMKIASYPPREVLWDYIKGRVEKANVRSQIRFRHPVRWVTYNNESKKFTVSVHNLEKDQIFEEIFDYVVVASGHFSYPNIPHFDGIKSFNGRVLHAHDFRDALEFVGKNVLLVGTSYSAEDIGSQLYKYGARTITCSYRSRPMGYDWPKNWKEVPLIQKIDKNIVTFKDGTVGNFDAIILCTGYRHHFPFLPDNLRLQCENRLWPLDLYKGIVFEKNPQLFYIGMQDQFYTFNMFDCQAWLARDIMLGRFKLPSSRTEMEAHSKKWREMELQIKNSHDGIVFQGNYVKELLTHINYPKFDVDAINEEFFRWKDDKHQDIMGYRNKAFKSIMTGNMSPVHHTPWLEALDDSWESSLKTSKI
jgi:trimethylamine monooxygenase